MPLVAHRELESLDRLRAEGQEILDVRRARHQDIRELHIGLLNLMPDGALKATERQFLRLIGNSNRIAQFYVHIFTVPGVPRSADMQAYIDSHYENFDDLARDGLDAIIFTGTNPLHADLAQEAYWPHVQRVFDWADKNVTSVLCSCLASHLALQHFHGIARKRRDEKLFGVFSHRVLDRSHPMLANINTRFLDVNSVRLNGAVLTFKNNELGKDPETGEADDNRYAADIYLNQFDLKTRRVIKHEFIGRDKSNG